MKINKNRMTLLGCPIDNLSVRETMDVAEQFIASGKPHQYIAINAGKIVKMRNDPDFRKIILDSDLNIVDGQPLMWISRLFGMPVKERFGGLDIIDAILPLSEKKGYGVYFLGGKEAVLKHVVDLYQNRYPGLKISGYRNGYWTDEQEPEVVEQIREAKADIIFFAMSSPKKEVFLKKYLDRMNIPFVVGVGGAFDVIAGKVRRAPQWVQNIGMEWLYRVLQEPGRLWKRYLIGNSIFVGIFLKEFFRVKVLRKEGLKWK